MKRVKKYYLFILLILFLHLFVMFCAQFGNAQISRDKLIEDVMQLVHILDTAHPDPYIQGGGKIAFHRKMQNTILQF